MAWRKSEGSGRLVFTDQLCDLIDRSASEEVADVDERIPLLRGCLDKLKQDDQTLVQLRYRDGQPITRIADSMVKSVDAISMRLSRIRRQLADCVSRNLNQETQYEI